MTDSPPLPLADQVTAASFASLGLSSPLLRAVSEKRYTAPTPIQLAAIPAVRAGRVARLPDDRVLRPGPQLPAALAQLQAALGRTAGAAPTGTVR